MRYLLGLAGLLLCTPLVNGAEVAAPPAWAAEAIFYQIFPERFANGDSKNDPTRDSLELPVSPEPAWRISRWTADWYSRDQWEKERGPDFYKHGVFDRRYGGDLKGVIDKLDYLTDLGINTIYFNP
ncbi:MAG TPA: alpha-amylase family glycosyl hydrolase, partial [Chthoniobacterales bacterium]|nr:alpha-amylase family glycosyl hydrolase [Chthoniobacterales bacterium]